MSKRIHIVTGLGPPASIPLEIGHHYIDTQNKISYTAANTLEISDWKQNGAVDSELPTLEGTFLNQSTTFDYSLPLDSVATKIRLEITTTTENIPHRILLPAASNYAPKIIRLQFYGADTVEVGNSGVIFETIDATDKIAVTSGNLDSINGNAIAPSMFFLVASLNDNLWAVQEVSSGVAFTIGV